MPASSSGGGGSPPARSPRIMKRELAFALQSLSASPASPGRTRSGRLIANAPVPGGKRRRRSEPDKDKYKEKEKEKERPDLVSPATPPMDAEAPKPKQPIPDADLMDVASFAAMEDVGAGASGRDGSDRGEEATLQELDGGVAKEAPLVVEEGTARMDTCYRSNGGGDLQQSVVATGDVPNGLGVAVSEEDKGMEACDGAVAEEDKEMDACDGAVTKEDDKQMDVCDDAVANDGKQMDVCDGADVVPDPQGPADAVVKEAADAVVKVASLVAGDNAAVDVTAERPTRRFTRSLLKNKPEEDSGGLDKAVSAPVEAKGASVDSVQPEKPVRRFTRSLLKAKADMSHSSVSVGSDETMDSTSDSASVKKMEMKMSKKVACLTKPPVNVRELLSTGLLEGMRVVYVIPRSKRDVLKGVIAGCNVRCFCLYCNGSKAISSYHFEQHAGSNKKHPSHYIYLENGNSLRDVLRESENSPLDTLEKTIRSSIDPMAKKRNSTCLNCSESLPPSQAESFLCHSCLELKQPQDPPSPSHPCGSSNPSLTSYSKGSSLKKISSNKKSASAGRLTTKDIGLHKLVFKVLLDGTEVAYYVDGKRKIDGYIKDQRIFCNHCNKVVSPSAFEAHAGEGTRRKPYDNIFTSNGVSLHELSMKISMNMTQSERETDDLCGECGEGGDIFPCKICPRSFHAACVGLAEVPSEWYCDNCSNHVQKEKTLAENKNAKAAGRQAGVDSIEQIMKRAIRIVPVSDDLGGCALCKQKDFNNSVFDERTVILCDQCEKEYHVGCLRSQCQVDLKELPEGEWFCCSSCSEIRSSLDEIISRGAELLPESDIDIIRKKCEMRGLTMDANMDIRWRLLAGRRASEDSNLLLSAAVPIIHESFDPIIEAHTGRDLIPEMVNGRRPKDGMPGQDYSGMYCALLTVGSSVVSAGLLRVMGGELAELPLVATSREFQGLGYFQVLFSRIEKMLVSLKIKHFMLPAAQEAEAIWTKKFGFSRIPQEQLEAFLNGAHLTIFHGTSNLYKAVPLS